MAHFYATIQGGRGTGSRAGHKTTGIEAHVRGWTSGVRVSANYDAPTQKDEFDIRVTRGSQDSGTEFRIGKVRFDGDTLVLDMNPDCRVMRKPAAATGG